MSGISVVLMVTGRHTTVAEGKNHCQYWDLLAFQGIYLFLSRAAYLYIWKGV